MLHYIPTDPQSHYPRPRKSDSHVALAVVLGMSLFFSFMAFIVSLVVLCK